MSSLKRNKTNYPGVFYIEGASKTRREGERIYYIRYRKNGRMFEEKVGRQFQDDMTPARAARIRAEKIEGHRTSNQERREVEQRTKERWTFDRIWEQYKAIKPELKGVVVDENRYVNHIRPVFGNKEPNEIAPLDVDRLRINLLKTHKPGTVKNVLELLRRVINFGVNKHLCEGAGFKMELPAVNNVMTEDLLPEQLVGLLEVIEKETNIQAANLMKVVLFTGMRRGELFKLKWGDIDFEHGFIHIRDPKGGHDQKIPLNEDARKVLESHPRTDSPYVFPGRGGRQRIDINKQVNGIKKRAGLPKSFRALHGLRHVYASMLASSGKVDMYTLQKLLTHKSPQMTQRYAHLRDDAMKKASNLAGELVNEVVKQAKTKSENG